jgi:hypothetical protein
MEWVVEDKEVRAPSRSVVWRGWLLVTSNGQTDWYWGTGGRRLAALSARSTAFLVGNTEGLSCAYIFVKVRKEGFNIAAGRSRVSAGGKAR